MKQISELVQILKPSEILRQAHMKKIRKIEGDLFDGNNGFCAVGVLEIYGNNRDNKILSSMVMRGVLNRMSMVLYDKKYHDLNEDDMFRILNIRDALIAYNDSSPDVSFSDCADYLEAFGL